MVGMKDTECGTQAQWTREIRKPYDESRKKGDVVTLDASIPKQPICPQR